MRRKKLAPVLARLVLAAANLARVKGYFFVPGLGVSPYLRWLAHPQQWKRAVEQNIRDKYLSELPLRVNYQGRSLRIFHVTELGRVQMQNMVDEQMLSKAFVFAK